jgi:hypothetical protein
MMSNVKGKKVQLYEQQGETSRYIDAEITQHGDLVISGQDLGKMPEKYWGDSDYEFMVYVAAKYKSDVFRILLEKLNNDIDDVEDEFRDLMKSRRILWIHLPAEQKDDVLLTLIKKLYSGNPKAVDHFKEFLRSRGIPCEFDSWA